MNKNHIKGSFSLFFICVVLASALIDEFDEDIVTTSKKPFISHRGLSNKKKI